MKYCYGGKTTDAMGKESTPMDLYFSVKLGISS